MQPVTDNFIHGSAAISNHTESEGILGADSLRIWQVTYVKRYLHKAIVGVGEVQLHYCRRDNGRISFTGFELFSGAIGNGTGSVVFEITGNINPDNGLVTAEQQLVRGSGSAELYSYSGKGSYVIAKNGYCSFEFSLHN